MRLIEVTAEDGRVVVDDEHGPYEADLFPVDEWRCADCHAPLGWTLWENYEGDAWLDWNTTYIPEGTDPLAKDTRRLCETCIPAEVTR